MVVNDLILFTVVKLTAIVSIVARAFMEIMTVLMVARLSSAVICVPVSVIKL